MTKHQKVYIFLLIISAIVWLTFAGKLDEEREKAMTIYEQCIKDTYNMTVQQCREMGLSCECN